MLDIPEMLWPSAPGSPYSDSVHSSQQNLLSEGYAVYSRHVPDLKEPKRRFFPRLILEDPHLYVGPTTEPTRLYYHNIGNALDLVGYLWPALDPAQ